MINPIASSSIGKHKIPQYLYHLTMSSNLPKIQRDGLQPGMDEFYGEGVFMFDMANMLKFWKRRYGHDTLQDKLLNYTADYLHDLTLLRIPTQKIDKSELVVRRLDTLLNLSLKYYDAQDIFRAYNKGEISSDIIEHITEGTPAKFSRILTNKKFPIEFIYPDVIDSQHIQILGQGKAKNGIYSFKDTMRNMLSGLPEEKMLDAWA